MGMPKPELHTTSSPGFEARGAGDAVELLVLPLAHVVTASGRGRAECVALRCVYVILEWRMMDLPAQHRVDSAVMPLQSTSFPGMLSTAEVGD